ncbi:amino acid permease [Ekhidna sp.]|jgi:APA family basic amino acid/polyamine antiporter|uniref:amino acid permease n=1 Tax=Ekhidna sp. TaxID=2608089 RepID=UPI0032F086CC
MSRKKLGFWTSSSLVVGNMIGSGIFLLPATLASFGSISILGWIISAFGAAALAYVFIEFSKMIPGTSGGPYVYSRSGLGDFAGFLVAWGYWISIWCVNAAIAIALVSYLGVFFPVLQVNNVLAICTGLAIVWGVVWVNTLGIREAGIFSLVTSILKITPLLAIGIFGLFYLEVEHFSSFNISGQTDIRAITQTATLTFFAYMGIECATIPSGDIENPKRIIPRSTYFGLGVVTVIYILGTTSLMGIIPPEELKYSQAPFADAASIIWGPWAENLVAIGAIISTLGALNGWILIQGQIPAAISRDKLFPSIFSKENKNGVPALSIVLSSILISLLMIMNYAKGLVAAFKFAILLSSMTALIAYLFTSVSYVMVTAKNEGLTSGFKRKVAIASVSFFFSIWAIAGSGLEIVYWGFFLLMGGLPVYVWMKVKNENLN